MDTIGITIDGRAVRVREGATLLDAARAAGIAVPTLCWYPGLPVAGSCRLCLVAPVDGGKPLAACATRATDGMAVRTDGEDLRAVRGGVLALLLERYPVHEIPAGAPRNEFEALVAAHGVAPVRRAGLPLRAGDDRAGDPTIAHAMSTCVLCTRCVRACEDLQVVGVLDVADRGAGARIIVGADGDPEAAGCTWCGECVRVCPTGAIHDVLPLAHRAAATAPPAITRTVCPYCAVGCQLDLEVRGGRVVRVHSPWIEEDTPNRGSTCVKGRFGADFIHHPDRLTRPLIRRGWVRDAGGTWRFDPHDPAAARWPRRGGPWEPMAVAAHAPKDPARVNPARRRREDPLGEPRDRVATPAAWYAPFREATWEEALDLTAQRLAALRDAHGADALAAFCSAKCSNEENYLLQRLFRAGLGTNNVDHCTRLCHSSSVAAMQRALATSAASGSMCEVETASDVIFILGANTTESHPVFGAAIKRAVKRGATLLVADPRRIELARRAHVHLQLQPGTDVALLNGMLHHVLARGLEDRAFIAARTTGFDAVRDAAAPYPPERAAAITGVPADAIRRAAEAYARGPRAATLWAMGLTQHHTGTDIVAALLNLMLACGMIGRWGAPMLPIRGQNNVQGASDVGGIPMFFTDYRPVTDPDARAEYAAAWGVPVERLSPHPGRKVTEVIRAGSGVRGMYIMGENPALSDPDVAHAEEWLRGLEFLAVQDLFLTETARAADVVLPGAAFAEKDGTYVNTERRIQLGRRAVAPPGEARGDLEILRDLSARLGVPVAATTAAEVMDEIARVTPSWRGVSHARLAGGGLQYPVPDPEHPGTPFLFADRFPTADGRARFVPVEYAPAAELPDAEFPYVLNTGRQMVHWHTGTMTRRAPHLDAREPGPIVELHPADAAALGVDDGQEVMVTSRRAAVRLAARLSDRVARGQVFIPMHFREAAVNLLTNPALDPHAGIPEFKVCAVRVARA